MLLWCVTVISRGARSTKVNTVPRGRRAIGRIAASEGHLALACAIRRSRSVCGLPSKMVTAIGAAAPSPSTTSKVTPPTATTGCFDRQNIGSSSQTRPTAPTIATSCAAGPARVCQASSPAEVTPIVAIASVRANRPRSSLHERHNSIAQPANASTGSAAMVTPIRHGCSYRGLASRTLASHNRSTSGETPSSRLRQCGQANAWKAAIATPAPTASASRVVHRSGERQASKSSSAPPSIASDSQTGESASQTGSRFALDAKMRNPTAVPPASAAA